MERRSAAQRERGSCHRLGRSGAARGCDRRARLPPLIRRTTMAYQGSCHCGAVSYTVEGDIPDTAMSCNCSHCRRKGFLLTFRSEEHTSELQSLMRITNAVFCLKKNKKKNQYTLLKELLNIQNISVK